MEKINGFSTKFAKKSESELQAILTSEQHVYEAKQAATWELERRALAPTIELKKPKTEPERQRYRMSKSEKKEAKWQMVLFGVAMIGIGIYFNYDTLMVTESSLVPIEGRIEYSKTFIERVSSRNRYGSVHYSNKATLEIKLFEHSPVFQIFENIEQSRYHQRYNQLIRQLTKRTPVTIWVSENHMRYGPDFFKLDVRGETELDMDYTTANSQFGFIFMLIFGSMFIYLGTRTDWMEKVREVFRN
jgi:hypothetical protein